MKIAAILFLACVVSWAGPAALWAQEADPGEQVSGEQPATETVEDAPPAPSGPPLPVPGDDVMHPTKHGIRFTRGLNEAFAQQFVKEELNEKLGLDDNQRAQLVELVKRQCWDTNLNEGDLVAQAIESFYARALNQEINRDSKKSVTPEDARKISKEVGPGAKVITEFWENLLVDAKPLLSDEQNERLKERADEVLKMSRKFEDKLDRWSRGEVKENETMLSGIDENDIALEEGQTPEYAQAARSARWEVEFSGPFEWRRFLGRMVRICKFDASQKQAGDKLLAGYTARAKAIMTKEWKSKAISNRVQKQLQMLYPSEPLQPWMHRLEAEYEAQVKPIQEMGRSFRNDVFALTTPEQRQLLIADLTRVVIEHGAKPAELARLDPFPQTQPEDR